MACNTFPRLSYLAIATLLGLAVACSSSPSNGSSDAGTAIDAGLSDAGQVDAGSGTDAGMSMDAGSGTDAGMSTDAGSTKADIELKGAWDDNYGDKDITVNDTLWQEDTVVSYDNGSRTAITQTYAASMYNPNLFNKLVWTAPQNGSFWFCTVDYALMTAQDAQNTTKTADASNPAMGGCGGFPWTQMTAHTPNIEVAGSWVGTDNSAPITVSDTNWGADSIVQYGDATDSTSRWAVTKVTPTSGTSTYNKLVWSAPANGSFSYCAVASAQANAEAASGTMSTADASNATTGCNGGRWTKLTMAQ